MDLMAFLSFENVTFRFPSAAGSICLFQRLLSVQSSLCFKTVSVWSQFLAIIFITFVCACRSSSVSVISEFSRPLLNVHFLILFLLNNYHHLSVLLHIVFSCFSSQGLSTGLAGDLYHSNFISQKKFVWVLFFKIRGSNSDVLYGMKIWGLYYAFISMIDDRHCLQVWCQVLKRPF